MAVAAGCTAFSAYLIGDVINQAYVNRNLPGIVTLGAITVVLFSIKGLATYGHSVMLSRIGNRIVADNQRAVFAKLLQRRHWFFLGSAFHRIYRSPVGRGCGRDASHQSADNLGRPRPVVADRPGHRHGGAGPTDVVFQLRCRSACLFHSAQACPTHLLDCAHANFMAAPASSKRCRKRCRASAS